MRLQVYLAIPDKAAYQAFLALKFIQQVLQPGKIRLVTYDPGHEVIFQWVK